MYFIGGVIAIVTYIVMNKIFKISPCPICGKER